jgi:glycosyltransferase involved in cell wall biosynthesis
LPVLSVDSGPIPEVVGDAGILLDYISEKSLAKAMLEILTDEKLQLDLRKKGLERAKLFSWSKAAKKTLDIYKSLASSKSI